MISIKLQESKNATVAHYRFGYENGLFDSREQMLVELAEDLLSQVTKFEEQKAFDVAYPNKKIVKLRVPVKYISETAKEEDKAIYAVYKALADDISLKGYGAIVLPAVRDDMGNLLFDLEVL